MLTDRFSQALVFAEKLHREQTRKGNDIPYVAHLLAVAAMAPEYGGDEDTPIATWRWQRRRTSCTTGAP